MPQMSPAAAGQFESRAMNRGAGRPDKQSAAAQCLCDEAMGERTMATTITPQEYIAWVQRSFNRIFGDALVTNGGDTPEYRQTVRDFKSAYGLGSSAEVGVREQNTLIKANHLNWDYVTWAQTALQKIGASGSAPTGTMDSATKTAIRSFQAYEGLLVDDGWIGAKTETALIKKSGINPPGHVTLPPKKPEKPEEIVTSVVVSGRVPRLIQRGVTCWAAAFAMMYGWKHGTKSIPEVLDEAGDGGWWTTQYHRGLGLTEGHTAKLGKILGLTGERRLPENWASKLSDHGPLMVAQDPGIESWLHWIVVIGWRKTMVFPNRSLDREDVQYNEPFSGASPYKSLQSLNDEAKSLSLSHYSWFHF
jgi:hypothetical protein